MKLFTSQQLDTLNKQDAYFVYCGIDSLLTHEINTKLDSLLDNTTRATYEFERSFLGPVVQMQRRGIAVSHKVRFTTAAKIKEEILYLENLLGEITPLVYDKKLNHRSPIQLREFFYDCLKIPPYTKSEKGVKRIIVNVDALHSISHDYVRGIPFARLILAIRDLVKQYEVLTKTLCPDGRWRFSMNIGGTETGRWSSSASPFWTGSNIQNIRKELRHIFIPDPGKIFINIDLQGAEARCVAYLSGDENYIKAVETGDVHTYVASLCWGFPPERALADQEFYKKLTYRDMSKKLTHGTSYLGSAYTLAINAKIEQALIIEFQHKFFKRFPGIRRWHESISRQLQENATLISPFVRRRTFWQRVWEDSTLREAVAFLPQSTVPDIINRVLYLLWYNNAPRIEVLCQVHDSILMQTAIEDVAFAKETIKETVDFMVPVTDINGITRQMFIPIEFQQGFNWGPSYYKEDKWTNPHGMKTDNLLPQYLKDFPNGDVQLK